jgi:transmembrane sensor
MAMQFPKHNQQGMDDDPLRREAAEWFVRLNAQEPDADEVGDWQRWLLKSEAHRQAFAEFEDLWQTIGQTEPHFEAPGNQAAAKRDPGKRWRWPVALAASVLFAAVGALFFRADMMTSRDLPSSALVQTRKAEDRTYALPDGSRIDVGASTRVVVDFGPATRNVFIDSGEAYFQVAHDSARPFVVHAGAGTITAVGTAFNVHTALGRVSVAVVEGTVKVENSGYDTSAPAKGPSVRPQSPAPVLVHAGEGVAYDRSVQPVESVDARVATSWRGGHLKFLREPLAYVVSDIERYADLQISIADPSLGELLYTGTVVPENLDDWLALLSHAFPIEVQRINKRAILLKRRDTSTEPHTGTG